MSNNSDDNVKVIVRCRPLTVLEVQQGHTQTIQVDEIGMTVIVIKPQEKTEEPPKVFTFDASYGPDSNQLDIYNRSARPIVENVLEGYNGTVFAYGQTGTGKTYTMTGESAPEKRGIIPNSFAHIFGRIAKSGDEKTFLVRVSYLEIYNEEIRDLLAKDQSHHLEIKERPDIGVYVKALGSVTVGSADEMSRIMELGDKNRSVAATKMNAQSSRSHAIFTVTVECSELGKDKRQHLRQGKLHLVDLAGSERQSKSGTTGERLKEATKINLSLSTLGNVISALVDTKTTHIPYRNSKLTRLLQDSLGGNSKTVMCANIGPASYNYDETLSTLRYANRAKNIKNVARINEDPKDALLRKFQQEIEDLKRQLENDGDQESGETDEDEAIGSDGSPIKRKRRKNLSDEKILEIEAKIEEDRQKLNTEKNMADDERRKLEEQLQGRENDLQSAKCEHDQLLRKLTQIEKKVIIGGENLLDKSEVQAHLLEESLKELESRRRKESQLRLALQQKQAERLDIEEKYSSLQDEATGKSRQLKKCWTLLMSAKSELADEHTEHQRHMESLLDTVRQLGRELKLQMLVVDSFIPAKQQQLIERFVGWDEEVGEWRLQCVAYSGNNMRVMNDQDREPMADMGNIDKMYLNYVDRVGVLSNGDDVRHRSRQKSAKRDRNAAQLKMLLQ